eukprot:7378767-Prymnesium_polylepis.1
MAVGTRVQTQFKHERCGARRRDAAHAAARTATDRACARLSPPPRSVRLRCRSRCGVWGRAAPVG